MQMAKLTVIISHFLYILSLPLIQEGQLSVSTRTMSCLPVLHMQMAKLAVIISHFLHILSLPLIQ